MVLVQKKEVVSIWLLCLLDGTTSYMALEKGLKEGNLIVSRLIYIVGNIAPIIWIPVEIIVATFFYWLIRRVRLKDRIKFPYEEIIPVIIGGVVINNTFQLVVL